MVKTIRVSDEFYAWIEAYKADDETMEEVLRRLSRGPHPEDVAGLLSPDEARDLKESVKRTNVGEAAQGDQTCDGSSTSR